MDLNQNQKIGEERKICNYQTYGSSQSLVSSSLGSLELQSSLDVEMFFFSRKAERWHMQGLWYETFKDQQRITIKDKMLRLQRRSRRYKDLEKSFYEVYGGRIPEMYHHPCFCLWQRSSGSLLYDGEVRITV